jgi:ketosteroid isomerase-like protein
MIRGPPGEKPTIANIQTERAAVVTAQQAKSLKLDKSQKETLMLEARNTKIVQDAFAAFGRSDIQTLLTYVADDVVWSGVYGAEAHVPTSGVRRGKGAVGEFFKLVAENVQFRQFEPKEFVATGDKVVALGHYAATTPTGKSFDSDFAMVFTLQDGKVTGFQEFCNSAAVNSAYAA